MEHDDAVYLVVPPDPRYLRTVRLVVAEAGRRAGFDVSEIDDLRIAVGELTQSAIASTPYRVVVRVEVSDRTVRVRGTARRRQSDAPPELLGVPALIVDAVSDTHTLEHAGSELWFELAKSATRAEAEPVCP